VPAPGVSYLTPTPIEWLLQSPFPSVLAPGPCFATTPCARSTARTHTQEGAPPQPRLCYQPPGSPPRERGGEEGGGEEGGGGGKPVVCRGQQERGGVPVGQAQPESVLRRNGLQYEDHYGWLWRAAPKRVSCCDSVLPPSPPLALSLQLTRCLGTWTRSSFCDSAPPPLPTPQSPPHFSRGPGTVPGLKWGGSWTHKPPVWAAPRAAGRAADFSLTSYLPCNAGRGLGTWTPKPPSSGQLPGQRGQPGQPPAAPHRGHCGRGRGARLPRGAAPECTPGDLRGHCALQLQCFARGPPQQRRGGGQGRGCRRGGGKGRVGKMGEG